MDRINTRVLIKEPRGFIRILQVVFSILAWSTTANFVTKSTLHIDCPDSTPFNVDYEVRYPFDLREVIVTSPNDCKDDTNMVPEKFPIDFSATSMLYVLVCVTSLLYALGSAIYYCLFTAKYETDPLAPMVDLCVTLLFTICWSIITCTWALNVSDLKHYTHPKYYKGSLNVCIHDDTANCQPGNPGKWSSLTVSIVCGFTCVVLWFGSTWFIFKETTLHKQKQQQQQQQAQQQQQQY